MYFICFSAWIMIIVFSNANGTSTLTLPPSVNCGEQTEMTCTSTDCNEGYIFIRDAVTIYNKGGPQNVPDPARYSSTVTSNSQVLLTITNIQLSDAGMYQCTCGFDVFSDTQTLRYECKAVSSRASITANKKLIITMDKLYPLPSSVVTSLINPTSQLQGTYTCGFSPTVVSHYTCTWNSAASLPDGNHSYTITVTISSEASPLLGSFIIVTPPSPTISNLSTISNNRQVVLGAQDTPLTIQCVSKGGIPAPTLAWYRGNTSTSPLVQSSTSDSVQQSDGTYKVTLIHNFTPRRRDDMTSFLCRVFYPGATTGASPDPSPASALLYLELKPDKPTVSQTGEAASGGSFKLRCTSTNGRPAPSIMWDYRDQTLTPTYTSSIDPTSETYTVVSVLQRPVSAVDNGQTATCSVFHTLLSVPLQSVINVDVKFGSTHGTVAISGNKTTPVTGTSQIQLNCTSGSSNPASNITWYNGSDVISNAVGYEIWPGNNNGVITSNNLTITPTRYMDGDRITCRTDNGYGSDSKYVDLDILYSCLIQTLPNVTAIEGEPEVTLTCSASSKPPANFTWYKGSMVLASGIGSFASNKFSYVIPRVDRTNAGRYTCHAGNNVGSPDSKDAYLIVKYPPTVTVSVTTSPPYIVTCKAEGFPDSYEYQQWVQIWPGYGPIATLPFNRTSLTLVNDTYERSAPPVLLDPWSVGARVRVSGRLGQDATIEIKYWSNAIDSVVRCYKLPGGSQLPSSDCNVTERMTEVTLPVYSHLVKETGTLATLKIPIRRLDDFTDYDIVVTNHEGKSLLGIAIVRVEPPAAPTVTDTIAVKPGQVILTVVPGFHGGYNQTLVVQISTDLTTWINKTSVNTGLDDRPTVVYLVNLQESTLHFLRMFAYNIEGSSKEFSTVRSFITAKDECKPSSSMGSTVAVSVSTTAFITIVLGIVVFVIVIRQYPNFVMRLVQHTCQSGNISQGTDIDTGVQSQSLKRSGKQVVYSTLVAAEDSKGENLETTPTYESLNPSGSQPVYTSLEAAAEQRSTYENLKGQ